MLPEISIFGAFRNSWLHLSQGIGNAYRNSYCNSKILVAFPDILGAFQRFSSCFENISWILKIIDTSSRLWVDFRNALHHYTNVGIPTSDISVHFINHLFSQNYRCISPSLVAFPKNVSLTWSDYISRIFSSFSSTFYLEC